MVTEKDSINQVEETEAAQDTPIAAAQAPVADTPAPKTPTLDDVVKLFERERERTRSLEVRLGQLATQNRELLGIKPLVKRGMAEEDIKAAEEETRQLQQQNEAQEYTQKQISSLNRVIDNSVKRLGKNLDSDPALAHLKVMRDNGALGEVALLLDEMVEADQANKAEQARIARQTRQEKLNIATPREAAAAIQITEDNADALYGQGKISDEQYRVFLNQRGIL